MEEYQYRLYIADSLYLHGENKRMTKRLEDLVNPRPEDDRKPDEIVSDIAKKAGLTIKK